LGQAPEVHHEDTLWFSINEHDEGIEIAARCSRYGVLVHPGPARRVLERADLDVAPERIHDVVASLDWALLPLPASNLLYESLGPFDDRIPV